MGVPHDTVNTSYSARYGEDFLLPRYGEDFLLPRYGEDFRESPVLVRTAVEVGEHSSTSFENHPVQ